MLDDYDGIVVDEGGFLGEDNNVVDRGISYVTFNSNQIKNVTNEAPTSNEDIRYQVRQDADGRDYVEINEDILEGVNEDAYEAVTKKGQHLQGNIYRQEKYSNICRRKE